MMSYSDKDLGQHWLLSSCLMAPSHYLNQYWLLISEILWHSPESNFTASTQATNLFNEFENYTFKIVLPHLLGANELILVDEYMKKNNYKVAA